MKKIKKRAGTEHSPDYKQNVQVLISQSLEQLYQLAIQRFKAGDLLQAEKICLQMLQKDPDYADANHILGVIATKRGDKDEAIRLITRAIQANPLIAEFHVNLGKALENVGRQDEAIDCFREALSLKPDHARAYNNLGVVLKNTGKLDEAIECFRKALLINPNFVAVYNNLGNAFLDSGRMDEAIDSFKKALVLQPGFAMAHYNLGTVFHQTGKTDEAIACYKKSLSLNPNNAEAYNTLGILSQDAGRVEEAIACIKKALSLNPDFAGAYNNLGLVHRIDGKMNEAAANFRKAISLDPDYAEAHLNLGVAFKESGQMDAAISSFKKALSLKSDMIGAFRNLAMSVKYTEMCDFIYSLEDMYIKEGLSEEDRMLLAFSLGKVYGDLKNYDKAFELIQEANRLKRKTLEYSTQEDKKRFDAAKKIFTPEFFSTHSGVGNPDKTPIFILGMPRSGTTLVEQILASHPRVFGAGELQIVSDMIKDICSGNSAKSYPECIVDFDADMFAKMGTHYIDEIRKYSKDADYITNKMPHNFLHVGLIKIILPEAKVIHCKRNPMDNCFSIFKHEFKGTHNYAYDLAELGHHYNFYLGLMGHWEDVLPGFMCNLNYEDMVADQEKQTRRLLDFCGLPWEDSCLAFHKTDRIVKTASFAQVRRPIYKDSVELWKRYEKHLEPLRKIVLG